MASSIRSRRRSSARRPGGSLLAERPHGLAAAVAATRRQISSQPEARGDRLGGRRLHRAQRRRVGRAREGLGEGTQRAEAVAERADERVARQDAARKTPAPPAPARPPKVVGGSTITQQLAKNLFLGGERSLAAQGAGAASSPGSSKRCSASSASSRSISTASNGARACSAPRRRHGATSASARRARRAGQAAQLAVLLPAPKRFEKRLGLALRARPRRDDRGADGRRRAAGADGECTLESADGRHPERRDRRQPRRD